MNLKVSAVSPKTSGPRANRRTKYAAVNASRVLPAAIAKDVAMEPYVPALTKKAPAKTAGQTQDPKSRHAASDMPEGAQIAVALGLTDAK
jgi:hypothetical protein